jgi:hypothetical protein
MLHVTISVPFPLSHQWAVAAGGSDRHAAGLQAVLNDKMSANPSSKLTQHNFTCNKPALLHIGNKNSIGTTASYTPELTSSLRASVRAVVSAPNCRTPCATKCSRREARLQLLMSDGASESIQSSALQLHRSSVWHDSTPSDALVVTRSIRPPSSLSVTVLDGGGASVPARCVEDGCSSGSLLLVLSTVAASCWDEGDADVGRHVVEDADVVGEGGAGGLEGGA